MLERSMILAFSLLLSSSVWAVTPMTPPTANPATSSEGAPTGSGRGQTETAKTSPKTTSWKINTPVQKVDPPKP